MIEIVAVFVACQLNLITCVYLPFIEKQHTFEDPDKCRTVVAEIIKTEQEHRIEYNNSYPIVMGKCKYYMREN